MKVAIYARVSRSDQNIDAQESACREFCLRNNHDIFAVYKDDGVSGMKESRPQFDMMMNDMRRGKINCVVVTKLDRIGRSLQHILSIFTELMNRGVHFIAVTQSIDTSSAAGKLQLHIFGAFAEFERNIISERTREGLKYAKNVGKRGRDKRKRKKRGVVKPPITLVEKR